MCWAADFSISRLVPTWSKAISISASPPIGWMDSTIPLPKALCSTISPLCQSAAPFDAPETGTFLHYVLEHTLHDLKEQGGADTPARDDVHAIAKKWTQVYVETMLGGLEQHSARFRHLFRRLVRMLDEILDNLLDEMERSDFEPIDFELDFSRGGDLPPT